MTDLPPANPISPLDRAQMAMAANPNDDAAAHRFYQILAETPLFLVLDHEVTGDTVTPRLFDLPSGALVVAFDSLDRMGAWAQEMGLGVLPYAELPGRIIAQQLADLGQNIALGLNFGAQTQVILPHDAMGWLAQMLDVDVGMIEERITAVMPVQNLPPALMDALQMGLAGAGGMTAYLAAVRYQNGSLGHVLAFMDANPQPALTRAIAEALAFSNLEAGALDVTFIDPNGPLAQRMRQVGQNLNIPARPATPADSPPLRPAPGSQTDKPPILR